MFIIIVALVMIALIAVHMARTFGNKPRHKKKHHFLKGGPSEAENQLLHLCHGDEEQYRRLVMREITQSPEISIEEAASRAAYRIRRDNT